MNKVVYIYDEFEEMYKKWITLYHVYEYVDIYGGSPYLIICNNGEMMSFPKHWFVTLEQYRKQRINKILE